jgi:ankyrin repeat protein
MRRAGFWLSIIAVSVWNSSCATPRIAANSGQIHLAAQSGDRAGIESALRTGMGIDLRDGHGMTPLLYAAATPNAPIVAYLLEKGADPNRAADDGRTPLLIAARKSTPQVVELLIDRGARVDRPGDDGLTALAIAAEKGDRESFELLLKRGADPNVSVANCDTALIKSILQKDPVFFELLMSAGADPNRKGRAGNTPLIISTFSNKPELVEKLLAAGARAEDVNDAGNGALHFATGVRGIDPVIAFLLVEKGADVNQVAQDGLTPLKAAGLTEKGDLIVYLYEKGARSDFDLGSDTGLEAAANVHHVLGDSLLSRGRMDQARDAYAKSAELYAKLAEKYNGDVTKLQWKMIAGYAALGLASAALSYGASFQARQQSRLMTQAAGMQYATQTRTGFQGYSSFMARYPATPLPTYHGFNTAVPDTMTASLEEQKALAKAKAKQFEERTLLIGKILACFDANPGGGASLDACVGASAKTLETR